MKIREKLLPVILRRPFVIRWLNDMGVHMVRNELPFTPSTDHIPDASCYRPHLQPWLCDPEFNKAYGPIAPTTIVSSDRCYTLWILGGQATGVRGDFFECGVYQGGTARLLADLLALRDPARPLHLFDTFTGMPGTGANDLHQSGDFSDTTLEQTRAFVGRDATVTFHPGFIPDTFAGVADRQIAFAHVDVDIYQSVLDCCSFIYPRLAPGGIMVFDDYGFLSCPGARKAIDEFFADKPEQPLVLSNAQAIVTRLPDQERH